MQWKCENEIKDGKRTTEQATVTEELQRKLGRLPRSHSIQQWRKLLAIASQITMEERGGEANANANATFSAISSSKSDDQMPDHPSSHHRRQPHPKLRPRQSLPCNLIRPILPGPRSSTLHRRRVPNAMFDPRALVSPIVDFARACAAFLRSPGVASVPGARERLNLCSGIFSAAREGAGPPPSVHDVDAVILACSQWQEVAPACEPSVLSEQPRTWATAPADVLQYMFLWLRALGGVREGSEVHARAPLFAGRGGFSQPWNSGASSRSWAGQTRWAALLPRSGAAASWAKRQEHCTSARSDFDQLSSPWNQYYLRCLSIGSIYKMPLSILASLLEHCSKLVIYHFEGSVECGKNARRGDAIIEGVRRLESLKFAAEDLHLELAPAVDRATGPNLIRWKGYGSDAANVAAKFLNLANIEDRSVTTFSFSQSDTHSLELSHLAAIAAGCAHLVSVDLSSARVTDTGVLALLKHCPAIAELSLCDTAVTVATIKALQPHRPLSLLALANDDDLRMFATNDSEIALHTLFFTRGA
ncbi:hypothetical protein BDK51DRAFT_53152 [Blyttiomyces helicus]|uniref:Uncharacterized protein n=1 Tax=Blyttiomyces helicus TaxID=388810 RepID=A0A4V1ISQ2_9FUNG|nr:hypothetical protein BDK51DRAFT_53152 [Blyttiomyces helicus]|eukprot:RKO94347.1 hypothetical protein BDK51DRAFT_53152 [Blyttiomyces helicus]